MGRHIEDALLKSGNQTLFGTKRIQGQFNATSLVIDGIVNDVNLTELINNQMKKHKAVQMIESKMDFRNEIEIFGNITIGGFYEGINLTNITKNKINTVFDRMTEVMTLTEDITTALQSKLYIQIIKQHLRMNNIILIQQNIIDHFVCRSCYLREQI